VLALALAAAVCGGPGHTLAGNAHERVFTRAGDVRACHRSRSGSWRLGVASRVDEARVAGRYALLRRGNRLTVYDVRRRRLSSAATPTDGGATYTRISFKRTGSAAYIARSGDGTSEVGTTGSPLGWLAKSPDIDASYLRYAGFVVAYRFQDGSYGLAGADELRPAPPGAVARRGRLRVIVNGEFRLTARLGDHRLALEDAIFPCVSSGGCGGVDGLRLEPPFVAARSNSWERGGYASGEVTVGDVGRGTSRRTCPAYGVGAFVLAPDGAVACARQAPQGSTPPEPPHQIVAGDTVLDEGPGIDLGSLRLRGDELAWLHDGTERSARLASQP
jgi:hypothetical protein